MAPLLRLTDVRAFVWHVGARYYASRGVAAGCRGGRVRIWVHSPLQGSRNWSRGGVRLCSATTATSPVGGAAVPALPRALVKPVAGDVWAGPESWVVFSDLHLSRRTCDVCLEVLQAVHAAAVARKAGIVFLGDFWHSRGALPVELLNMAIMELRSWQCPAIFIPGNHDQVNLEGQVHALQVLEAANPYIKVLSSPVEYMGALWLPFRRDHSLIEKAVQQHGQIHAIFAHLDIVGAFLNEASQAKEGIEPSVFPQDVPVYTGHYHKPHVVKGTRIEYVGSPYQVSAGECEQTKRFLVLDKQWQKIGEIPLDIGPRHFIITHDEKAPSEIFKNIQEGDRVRWHLPSSTLDDSVKLELEKLQARGVSVDTVFPIVAFKQRIKEAENLDIFGLFELYAQSVEMNDNVVKMATDMLRSLNLPAKLIQRPQVRCELKCVELEGFGAFLSPAKYPLAERSVRIVSGKNLDSMGADSNGAGKTTLVMAPLWALTGSTDPRPDSARGLPSAEVVHHAAKRARVRVDGTINGKPFTVERTTGRKASLTFIYDEEDLTCQEIRMTQFRIDELIDTSVLYRTVFQGQHGGGGLLEASDREFKEELSKFMAMEVWMAAKEHSAKVLRNKKTEVEQVEGALEQLGKQYEQLQKKVDVCMQRSQDWEVARCNKVTAIETELRTTKEALQASDASFANTYSQVSSTMAVWETLRKELEQALKDGMESWSLPIRNTESQQATANITFERLLQKQAELSQQVRMVEASIIKKEQALEAFQENVTRSVVCDKCLQPIDAVHSSQSLSQLKTDLATTSDEREHILKELNNTESEVKKIRKAMDLEKKAREMEAAKEKQMQMAFKQTSTKILSQLNRIRQHVSAAQMALNIAGPLVRASSEDICAASSSTEWLDGLAVDEVAEGKSEEFTKRERKFLGVIQKLQADVHSRLSIEKSIKELEIKYHSAKEERNRYEAEYDVLSTLCLKAGTEYQKMKEQISSRREEAGWLKEIDTAFGLTGVQSYILEGALADVQERTARYLEMLSGGSLGLLLRPTKVTKSSKSTVEAIDKVAVVRLSNGILENRSLRQLSGGERRRMALALALGYSEFASQRGGIHCNLLVLDEVLQHLDGEGQARVVAMLKGLPQTTVLVVSQAHSLLAGTFDLVDWVIKQRDNATVEIAEESLVQAV
ncbi:hypothetical protein M758_4G159600 [Ceratodon purpureus]|nr:hypothetical protein M758_4G159600 [Ceratodon purpureus]